MTSQHHPFLACPSAVRATSVLPWRVTVRCGRRRSARSIASASGFSSPLTEAMSTRAAVSVGAVGVQVEVVVHEVTR